MGLEYTHYGYLAQGADLSLKGRIWACLSDTMQGQSRDLSTPVIIDQTAIKDVELSWHNFGTTQCHHLVDIALPGGIVSPEF